jgi:hypothetical protein
MKEIKYTTSFNPDIAAAFSKSNCKKCSSKGYIKGTSPEGEKYTMYCSCVKKILKSQKISY